MASFLAWNTLSLMTALAVAVAIYTLASWSSLMMLQHMSGQDHGRAGHPCSGLAPASGRT